MVASFHKWFFLLGIIAWSPCDAISCFEFKVNGSGYLITKDICDGDLCVYYQPGPGVPFLEEKSCATGFELQLGCQRNPDDESVMCICDTDFCNTGKVAGVLTAPENTCYVQNDPRIKDETGRGTMCAMSCGVNELTNVSECYVSAEHDFKSYALPPGDPDLTQFHFYKGMVHSFLLKNAKFREVKYECFGDLCNSHNISSLPMSKNVTCYDDDVRVPSFATCKGEFCVFAVDPVRDLSFRYCMSTYNLQSNHSYKEGIYKYKTSTFYLCKEHGCNHNETVANESVSYVWIAVEKTEMKISLGAFGLTDITPEYIFVALSSLSATVFISITIFVLKYVEFRFDGP